MLKPNVSTYHTAARHRATAKYFFDTALGIERRWNDASEFSGVRGNWYAHGSYLWIAKQRGYLVDEIVAQRKGVRAEHQNQVSFACFYPQICRPTIGEVLGWKINQTAPNLSRIMPATVGALVVNNDDFEDFTMLLSQTSEQPVQVLSLITITDQYGNGKHKLFLLRLP